MDRDIKMDFWTCIFVLFAFFAVLQLLNSLFPTLKNKSTLFNFLVSPSMVFSGPVDSERSDSYYYSVNKKQIRFSPMGNWFSLGNSLVEGADIDSFEVIARNFAKDKYQLYYGCHVISGQVDYDSFEIIEHDVIRDKYHVFIHKRSVSFAMASQLRPEQQFIILGGADPATFILMNDFWAKDCNHHYYNFVRQNIGYDTFSHLTESIVKDQHSVFIKCDDTFNRTAVSGVGVKAFDERYIYDDNHLYWHQGKYEQDIDGSFNTTTWLECVPYKDINTLKVLDDDYFIIDSKVYLGAEELPNAKANEFELLSNFAFGCDSQQVFYLAKPLEKVVPEHFTLLSPSGNYSSDKNHLYFKQQLIGPYSDERVELSNNDFLKTTDAVYYQGTQLESVDVQEFALLERFAMYGCDGKTVYFGHHKIHRVDLDSMEVVNRDKLLKDADAVYWHEKKVLGADPKTFTISHRDYDKYDCEDDYYFYKEAERVGKK